MRNKRSIASLLGLVWLLLLATLMSTARAGEVANRVRERGQLLVCIWPAYQGISHRHPRTDHLVGLDIDLSIELAHDLGVALRHVDSSFQTLIPDLLADRCDVAMFAIAVLPQRAAHLNFSKPYLSSDIYAVTTRSNRVVRRWEDIDQPGVRVAVQASTFMQPVMARTLRLATLVVVEPPASRERELESGRIDVFMTDYPYSRTLQRQEWTHVISPPQPFNVVPYAYAVKPGDDAWLQRINDFVGRIQQDGRLAAAARRHGLADIVVRP
ncbi:ABC transporter substrate-binding protein [Sphaerotilus mobilis]|uniref:ABC-type amino acid transport substrate-binding protein n=1 Tax=Sphaerotilus mobilis TaxID=47994 RepID=A0A4Q7LBX6_9BURK|nr:ABC transporter substrate-binding protein [Sphaerotilus mobilis]RZS46712.1 ABC-type amino acid transport substrate-binding protein [Sphaerotilus mobilis]